MKQIGKDILRLFNRARYNISDTIVICGCPRSGTTWLAEILASIPGYGVINEPLQINWFPEAECAGFSSERTYKRADEDWPEGEWYLRSIFAGNFDRPLVGSTGGKGRLLSALGHLPNKKIIAKFVRANRLLPWMALRFPVKAFVLIIRHPCAVVASQMKSGIHGNLLPNDNDLTAAGVYREAVKIGYLGSQALRRIQNVKTEEELLAAIGKPGVD